MGYKCKDIKFSQTKYNSHQQYTNQNIDEHGVTFSYKDYISLFSHQNIYQQFAFR